MAFAKRYTLYLTLVLLLAGVWPGIAQPGGPPQDEQARKAQALTADLFIAIRNNDVSAVNATLSRGADPNNRNWLGFSGLMWAAMFGNQQIVDTLIAHHAQLEASSVYGTALSFALVGRQEATALHLLDKGAGIHSKRADMATPLMLAASNGETRVLQRLLAKKDSPNAVDADGNTPLIYAARYGKADAAQILLQAGAKIDWQDSQGRTPLMYAAENGHITTVALLLAHKAQLNLQDKQGATALMLAARHSGSAEVAAALLKSGANADLKDSHSATALALAKERGFTACVRTLTPAGASGTYTLPTVASSAQIEPAIEHSLNALQTGMKTFAGRVQCSSCHHQGLGMIALGTAAQHGFAVDRALVGSYLKHMGDEGQQRAPAVHLALHNPEIAKGIPAVDMGEFLIGAGYLFNGLIANGVPANPGLAEMALLLTTMQGADGHWGFALSRGPMQSSHFTTTALVLQILQTYGGQDTSGQVAAGIQRAKQWLLTTPTPNTEDKSSRLLALKAVGASKEDLSRPIQELLAAQQADGGWSQTGAATSDAYATGMALYALHVGGELSTDDAVYQRGIQFLLRTQEEDGSWYVNKTTTPANNFLDAGFPHGESQYISFAATCWAMMALAQTGATPLKAAQ